MELIQKIKSLKKKTKSRKKCGEDLFHQVVKLTGIPSKNFQRDLKAILVKKNIDVKKLTVEQLRSVAASYLREIMGGLLDRYANRRTDSSH